MSTLILLPDSLMSFAVWVDEVPIALIKWQGLSYCYKMKAPVAVGPHSAQVELLTDRWMNEALGIDAAPGQSLDSLTAQGLMTVWA